MTDSDDEIAKVLAAGPHHHMGARSAQVRCSWATNTQESSEAIAELWSEFMVKVHALARESEFDDLDTTNPDVVLCDLIITGDLV